MNKRRVKNNNHHRSRNRKRPKVLQNWKTSDFLQTGIFLQSNTDSSHGQKFGLGDNKPSENANLVNLDEVSIIGDAQIRLTPSKSESNSTEALHDHRENNISYSLSEASFAVCSDEEDFQYHDITDEFVQSYDIKAKIVSPLKNVVKDHKPTKNPERSFVSRGKVGKRQNTKECSAFSNCFKNKNEELNVTNISRQKLQYHCTSDGILVVLEENDIIYFFGLLTISVVHGDIEILGHKLTTNSKEVNLYSARGTSLLYFKNITKSDIPISNHLLPLDIFDKLILSGKCAIVFCKKLLDSNVLFVEKHISQQILPKEEDSVLPRVNFQPKGSWNLLKINQNWNNIIDAINESTRIMFCGGKGVGKTTFLRYAINRLLTRFPEVRVIDLDPGQSEFTVPGCISVIRVNKPIFGSNYTHLLTPDRSILSNINVAYEPDLYIKCVKCLLNTAFDSIPTLVNYMGYTRGVGINILSATVIYVSPTDIIQIYSENSKKNYECVLNPDTVLENSKLFVDSPGISLNYNLFQVKSVCDSNDGWTAEPRQLREMCILSYLNNMIDSQSMFKLKTMYKISLLEIHITDLQGQIIHPAAINACLVALCSLEENAPHIFQCFGWGVVRGIDETSNEILLLTCAKLDTLNKVHYLVAGGPSLPPSVYMTPDEVVGPMPYVIEGVLTSFGQIPKRSRTPANNNK